jgi:hypothetical protein
MILCLTVLKGLDGGSRYPPLSTKEPIRSRELARRTPASDRSRRTVEQPRDVGDGEIDRQLRRLQ